MWTWLQATSTAVHDAVNLAVILDPLAKLKKQSQRRVYQYHHCGDQEVYRVNGLTYAVV